MPRNVSHHIHLSGSRDTGSNSANVSTRRTRVRCCCSAAAAILLLVCVCLSAPALTSAPTAANNTTVDAAFVESIPSVSSALSDAGSFFSSAGRDVALQYTFGGRNLVLVLSENGFLHAYHLESGRLAWSSDVGGDMVSVEVEVPPSRDTILRDPLALPFFVRGNSLFTRTPFYTYNPTPSSSIDTAELLGDLPDFLRPYFFMNISTLMRRQTVFFGGTDVFVTTSVEVADLDSSNGHHVNRQRRGGGRDGSGQRTGGSRPARTVRHNASSSAHNELVPILHVVRYNIVLHAVRADEYSWSITLSQLQLSPRTSISDLYRRTAETVARTAAKEHDGEANPRFFSHVMRDLFDYDATHAKTQQRQRVRDSHVSAVELTTDAAAEKASSLSPEAAAAAILDALERHRTQVAEYVSRVLSMQQYNRSHIRLQNLLEDTTTWTATLPSSARTPVDLERGSGDADDDGVTASLPSSVASTQAVASYVWVSEAKQIFRIPVQRAAGLDAAVDEAGEGGSGERRDGMSVDAQRGLLSATTTFAGTVVRTPDALVSLQLVPSLHATGASSAGMNHATMAMDVEGDEREGEELDRYYHEGSWWETRTLASSPLLSTSQSTDNVFASFSSSSDVVRTGLAWRTAGVISFHVLCLAGSIAFLCAGVPPRNQLQRAWAQADRNRDRLSQTSASRPQSAQLVPLDFRNSNNNSDGGVGSPFSPVIDGFSVDSPIPTTVAAAVKERSPSPARLDSNHSGDDEEKGKVRQQPPRQHVSDAPPHRWDDRTPEEVYAMMREENEEKASELAGHGSATEGKTLTSSNTTQQSHRSATDGAPPTASEEGQVALRQSGLHSESSAVSSRSGSGSGTDDGDDDDDEDSEEIDMGERWWVRAQHPPRLPSVTTLDETISDKASSVSFSPVHNDGGGVEEEGKLFQLHFKVIEKIGFGGEGSVFCVEHRVTHARYAIKAILIHEQDEERVVQEAVLHSSFDNANVVRFYFCWIEDIAVSTADQLQLCNREDGLDTMSMGFSDRSFPTSSPTEETLTDDDKDYSMIGDTYHMLFIQMEYFPRGTLADWLRSRKGFYRLQVLHYMQNIVDGLAYLHNQDVVHRDLKPTNIFVSNANVLKIGDFGLAKRRIATTSSNGDLASNVVGGQQERSVVGGSPLYCSPEQMRGDPVNKPSDIFSFGIIAVEMLCTFATLHERIRILTDAHQAVLPAEMERDFPEEVQIIRPLLASEPQQRPALRKVQRQLMRLVDALEDSEQDGDDVPHSPSETVEASLLLSAPVSHAHGPKATATAAAATATASTHTSSTASVATVGVFTSNNSPMLRTSTAASFTAAKKSTAAADVVHHVTVDGSPLSDAPRPELSAPAANADADAQPLPEWQVAALTTEWSGSTTPVHSQSQQPLVRRESMSSAHSTSFTKHRNSYHDRRYASSSSSPGTEAAATSSGPETVSQGGGCAASPAEMIVTDPYGPPTTPVTYTGDADLSSILKRDLQDRTISPPD